MKHKITKTELMHALGVWAAVGLTWACIAYAILLVRYF